MKIFNIYSIAVFLPLAFTPALPHAEATPASITIAKENKASEAEAFLARLNEIKAMDKSRLTSVEKKDLRKELRSINAHLKKADSGIYYAAGTVIVVIVLLVLLL